MKRRRLAFLVLGAVLAASAAAAQIQRGRFAYPIRWARPESFDGAFLFCRVIFRNNPAGDGGNWSVDYPRADLNLPFRLGELTKTSISREPDGSINHVVVRLTDQELFHCPFIMMTEVGAAYFDQSEAAGLRDYLLKGGFLWADDFWGSYAWDVWANEIAKVLPPGEYPIVSLPLTHTLFHTLYDVTKIPQIPSIGHWLGSGGGTSERGFDSAEPHVRAILDANGRVMVLITHNTDFGDAFEREGDSHQYFLEFAGVGYAFGVDALLYAMTH